MRFARIAIGTFLTIVLLVALFFAIRLSEGSAPAHTTPQAAAPALTLLAFKENYHKGVDQISGSVLAPTPCTPVTATSSTLGDGTVRIDISSAQDTGLCLQLPASTTFSVSAASAPTSTLKIYLNGSLATSTL